SSSPSFRFPLAVSRSPRETARGRFPHPRRVPMSTKLHDLVNQADLKTGASPQTATSTVTGTGVDMINADSRCFAVQHVGAVSGTSPTLDGKIQESDSSGSGYSDVTGATFTQVTASTNLQVITFERTKRYL